MAARGGFHVTLDRVPWGVLIYLAVIATALVIALQTWALARTSPVKAAVLFATEPIFAALFAVAFFGEGMTPREIIGGAVILLGVIVTELWRPWMARLSPRWNSISLTRDSTETSPGSSPSGRRYTQSDRPLASQRGRAIA